MNHARAKFEVKYMESMKASFFGDAADTATSKSLEHRLRYVTYGGQLCWKVRSYLALLNSKLPKAKRQSSSKLDETAIQVMRHIIGAIRAADSFGIGKNWRTRTRSSSTSDVKVRPAMRKLVTVFDSLECELAKWGDASSQILSDTKLIGELIVRLDKNIRTRESLARHCTREIAQSFERLEAIVGRTNARSLLKSAIEFYQSVANGRTKSGQSKLFSMDRSSRQILDLIDKYKKRQAQLS